MATVGLSWLCLAAHSSPAAPREGANVATLHDTVHHSSHGPHGPGSGCEVTVQPRSDELAPLASPEFGRGAQLLWSRSLPDPIYTTVGISAPTGTVFAGNYLNPPRQAEAIPLAEDGTPAWVRAGTEFYVDAARGADILAALDCTQTDSTVTIMEWRAGSSTPLWSYAVHPCRPLTGEGWSSGKGIQVSDDGSTIAAIVNAYTAGGLDVRLVVFDAGSGLPAVDLQLPDGTGSALAVTPDGAYIAIYAWPFIYVYDRVAETLRWSGAAGSGNDALAISPDGDFIAWGWNVLNLRQWNGSTYQSLWTISKTNYYLTECAISSDNTLAVAWYKSTFDDTLVELYTLPAHALLWDYSYTEDPPDLRSPGDALQDSGLLLPTDVISELAWSSDGSFLGAASWGPQFAEIHVWSSLEETPAGIFDTPGTMFDIDVDSPAPGQAHAVAGGKHVHAGTAGRGADLYALRVSGSSAGPEAGGWPSADPRLTVYPNPAAGPIAVAWQRTPGDVAGISIYDVQGRLVAGLNPSAPPERAAPLIWDGRDLSGRFVPPGFYLVRLVNRGRTYSRRVIVVR